MSTKSEIGDCRFETVFLDGERKIRIVQADERIRIAQEFLDGLDAELHPDVSYGDGILTIRAINGTVSYGVGSYDLLSHTREGVKSP